MSVPASINERLSSGNVAVQEGRDISITCSVFGIPQPEVTWYRRAGAGRLADSDNEQCQLATTGMERRPSQTNRASPRLCMKKFWKQCSRYRMQFRIQYCKTGTKIPE